MEWWQLYILLAVVIAGCAAGFIIIRKKLKKKAEVQQTAINERKETASILVLGKRMDKIVNANLPKAVISQVPKVYKLKKVPIVRAKIGPRVLDLLCDEAVFDKLPEKKTVRVEIAGIFIAGMKQDKR